MKTSEKLKNISTDDLMVEISRRGEGKVHSYKSIIDAVAEKFYVSVEKLKAKKRTPNVVKARNVCFYIIHKRIGNSSTSTGNIFDKDHATVLHGCRRVEKIILKDEKLSIFIDKIVFWYKINKSNKN